ETKFCRLGLERQPVIIDRRLVVVVGLEIIFVESLLQCFGLFSGRAWPIWCLEGSFIVSVQLVQLLRAVQLRRQPVTRNGLSVSRLLRPKIVVDCGFKLVERGCSASDAGLIVGTLTGIEFPPDFVQTLLARWIRDRRGCELLAQIGSRNFVVATALQSQARLQTRRGVLTNVGQLAPGTAPQTRHCTDCGNVSI